MLDRYDSNFMAAVKWSKLFNPRAHLIIASAERLALNSIAAIKFQSTFTKNKHRCNFYFENWLSAECSACVGKTRYVLCARAWPQNAREARAQMWTGVQAEKENLVASTSSMF